MRVLRISHSAVVDDWRERERALRRQGVEVCVVAARRWREGAQAVDFRARPGEDAYGIRTVGRHPALFLYDPRPLWRLLGEGWSVIDIHEEPYALATAEILVLRWLRRSRVPYVIYSAQNIRKRYPWPFRSAELRALRGAAAVQTCNADAAQIVGDKGYPGRVEVIPLGISPEVFHRRSPSPHAGLRVGFVGRLDAHKGVHIAIEAIARCRDVEFVIVGDGPERGHLEELAERLGIAHRVIFSGAIASGDMPQIYSQLDGLIVPSLDTPRWREQFGRVAIEAMSCGTPVIASDSGALPDVVGNAGIVVPQADPTALVNAIGTLADPDTVAALRASGHARAAECSWDHVAGQLHEVYQRCTAAREATDSPLRVVIVAYGDPTHLARCLSTLRTDQDLPITVVDNGGDPRVRALAKDAGTGYLDPGHNVGYAAAVNLAMSPGHTILLVNPDALVTPAQAKALHKALVASSDIAACAPMQRTPEGGDVRVHWPWPSPLGSVLDAMGLGRLRRPRYVTGAVLALRSEAIAQLGGFDERFFLYAEEADWQRRATRMGWTVRLLPEVVITHVGGASSADAQEQLAHFTMAQEHYLRKHFGTAGWHIARFAVRAGAAARWVALPRRRVEMCNRWTSYARRPRVKAAS